jgi:hypothetical protein
MNWFRTKLKRGATLALMALAINLALAFGHCHVDDGRSRQAAIAALNSGVSDDGNIPITDDDDGCAICKAVAALGSALAATPPALPLIVTFARLDLTPMTELAVRQFARADARARGPPFLTLLT